MELPRKSDSHYLDQVIEFNLCGAHDPDQSVEWRHRTTCEFCARIISRLRSEYYFGAMVERANFPHTLGDIKTFVDAVALAGDVKKVRHALATFILRAHKKNPPMREMEE